MRHYYKSHGKHCHLRSFQVTCKKCGADVLYWECTHGCKVFFEYPPYGKLIRHICRQIKGKNIKNKYPVIVRPPKGLLEKASPNCPVCGKIFKNDRDLSVHLKQLSKTDVHHKTFVEGDFLFDDITDKQSAKKEESNYSPKFGRINIKKRNN